MFKASVRAVRKSGNGVKTKLRSFLDAKEPGLVKILQRLWENQTKAITYKEIREAILSGEFAVDGVVSGGYAEKWLDDWRQDYSRFVQDKLLPKWEEAIKAGAKEIQDAHPGWYFNPSENGVREWARTHGAAFVTNSTQAQIDGLRAVIRRASTSDMHGMSVDKLAHVVRPFVGLTIQHTARYMNYYNTLISGGMSEKKALDMTIRFGQRLHRYRGYNIARTELAFAYNRGAYYGIKQAQRAGLMGRVVKVWVVAEDERTCSECSVLNGARIALDDDFDFYTRLTEPGIHLMPPAHPSCRCSVAFEEVGPPDMEMLDDMPVIYELYGENGERYDLINETGENQRSGLQSAVQYDIIEEVLGETDDGYTTEELAELRRDYEKSRANNMISAFTPFDDYVKYKRLIDSEIVGLFTVDGIEIKGQTKHFIERVFGTTQDPKTGRSRSGVDIGAIIDALKNPVKIVPHGDSIQYRSTQCYVSINPKTGMLIQTNPHVGRLSDAKNKN